MARTKKKTETVLNQDTFSDDLPSASPIEPPTVREKHTVVTQWVQQKPLGAEPVVETDSDDDDEEVFDFVPDDPIAEVVEEMAESSLDWSLAVYRLPGFEENGKAGAGHRKFSGAINIPSPEWLRNQFHLEEIQRKFAREGMSNYFAIEARKGNRIKKTLGVVAVEPLPAAHVPGVAGLGVDPNGSTINVYGSQQNQLEAIDTAINVITKLRKLEQLSTPASAKNVTPIHPQVEPQQPPQLSGKALIIQALADEDSVFGDIKSILKKVNGDSQEDNIWSAVAAWANSPILAAVVSRIVPPQQHQATGNQPADSPPPMPPDVAAQQRLLAVLTNAMRLNSDVSTVLPALDGFTELFPEHRGMIEQFLTAETQQLLGALSQFFPPSAEVVGLPHAAEWVDKLKALYFGEQSELEGSQQ